MQTILGILMIRRNCASELRAFAHKVHVILHPKSEGKIMSPQEKDYRGQKVTISG